MQFGLVGDVFADALLAVALEVHKGALEREAARDLALERLEPNALDAQRRSRSAS